MASLVIVLVFLGIFYSQGLYADRGGRRVERDFAGLFRGVMLGSLLVLALTFFVRYMTFSRWFFGLFFWFSWVFLCLGRVLARRILARVLHRGMRRTRMLLVGSNPMRGRLLRMLRELPGLALRARGLAAGARRGRSGAGARGADRQATPLRRRRSAPRERAREPRALPGRRGGGARGGAGPGRSTGSS